MKLEGFFSNMRYIPFLKPNFVFALTLSSFFAPVDRIELLLVLGEANLNALKIRSPRFD